MTRLLRILKIVKESSKLQKQINEFLRIGVGFERLIFFCIILFLLCHIVSCLWIISAEFSSSNDGYEGSWMDDDYILHLENYGVYLTSFYFTISTITTVGYGDLHGTNLLERGFGIIIMIIGVISFSFATGSLSSIL